MEGLKHTLEPIPFDDLCEGDKTKDYVIVKNIPYILGRGELDLNNHPQ